MKRNFQLRVNFTRLFDEQEPDGIVTKKAGEFGKRIHYATLDSALLSADKWIHESSLNIVVTEYDIIDTNTGEELVHYVA